MAHANEARARAARLHKLAQEVIGLDVCYTLATGEHTRRIYLDSTASTLRLKVVQEVLDRFQPFYSNTHSVLHFGAKLSTHEYEWAHQMVLDFVQADPAIYTSFFVGSGATGGLNRVARTLRAKRPERDVVITSIMEHHSNDLPHRKHFREVVHVPAKVAAHALGCVDLRRVEEALQQYGERVNYVALTGVSNVTGIINPIQEVAKLAHRHGALMVVDAAQMAAHVPIAMTRDDLDILAFSGHKIYAPGSPGVVVARQDVFTGIEPDEVGGGMVDMVYVDRYSVSPYFPHREEAGTPNISGAIGLAAALYALQQVGMDYLAAEENELIAYALERLATVPEILIYGETDTVQCQRAGAISFNLKGLHHAFTAAVLNDYFNISVRNECFCAHPYVREMVRRSLAEDGDLSDAELEVLAEMHKGMVRASFGIYNTRQDVDALAAALHDLSTRREFYAQQYTQLPNDDYQHRTFRFDHAALFSVKKIVDEILS